MSSRRCRSVHDLLRCDMELGMGAGPWLPPLVGLLLSLLGCGSTAVSQEQARAAERHQNTQYFCIARQAEVCFNARDDNCNGIADEGCGLATGLVQFVIGWDKAAADVDLIVRDPHGEIVEVGKVTSSGLAKDRDCPGKNQDCQGHNIENVVLDAEVEPLRGHYRATIRLENLHGEEGPINIELFVRLGREHYQEQLSLTEVTERRFEFVW